jgi:general secretion pathway protein J
VVNTRTKKQAFTLLELLAAMALMVVIAAALYGSLYTGFKARESSEAAVNPIWSAYIAIEMLEEDIKAALPPTGILAGEFNGVDEQDGKGCDSDNMVFYCSNHKPSDQEIACDIRKVELALVESTDSDNYMLVRKITTNLLSPRSLEPEQEVLCRAVKSLNIRYFDGFDWVDEWDSGAHNDTLPEAVEVSLEVEYEQENATAPGSLRLTRAFAVPCSSPEEQSAGSGTSASSGQSGSS